MVRYKKGHKNSKGENAPWTIVSCQTGKILSSHKTKEAAEEHLQQMEYYKHAKQESVDTPVTEGVKDYLLAGALAVSPMAGHAATGDQHVEELPAVSVEQLKTLKFNPHVKYKLTPQQYQILSASGNLPVDYIVPKPKSDTAKTVAKKTETPKTEPVKAEQPKKVAQSGDDASCGALCHLGKAAGAGAKSVWNGIKSFASGVADGWSKTESVSEFQQWLGEQPRTPLIEAVQQMYGVLFENSVSDQLTRMIDEDVNNIKQSNAMIDQKYGIQATEEEQQNIKRLNDFKQDLIKMKSYVDKTKSNELLNKYIAARQQYIELYKKLMSRNLDIKRQQYKELDNRKDAVAS